MNHELWDEAQSLYDRIQEEFGYATPSEQERLRPLADSLRDFLSEE